MSFYEELKSRAEGSTPAANLAKDLLDTAESFRKGIINSEEFVFNIQQIRDIRAKGEILEDDETRQYIIDCAKALLLIVR